MNMMTATLRTQPDSVSISEARFDTLELIAVDDHLNMIQVSEDGDSETLVLGPQQLKALYAFLQQREGGR
jgi:hypothetical protein